jgi:hypothetical protein
MSMSYAFLELVIDIYKMLENFSVSHNYDPILCTYTLILTIENTNVQESLSSCSGP